MILISTDDPFRMVLLLMTEPIGHSMYIAVALLGDKRAGVTKFFNYRIKRHVSALLKHQLLRRTNDRRNQVKPAIQHVNVPSLARVGQVREIPSH